MINKDSVSYNAYDQMAEYYFKYVDSNIHNGMYERPNTLSLLPNVEGLKVLDAGCASGWYTKWFLDHNAVPIALDFNEKMVEYTKIRTNNQCRVFQHDLNNPIDSIEDNTLDIIVSSLTLHYLKDWKLVMSEFYKKLKPNGILVFSTHHPFMDFHYFKVENYYEVKLLNDTWKTHQGKVDVQFYRRSLEDIINMVLNAGFKLDKILEGKPVKEMEEVAPEKYLKLSTTPQFLFIRAKKTTK